MIFPVLTTVAVKTLAWDETARDVCGGNVVHCAQNVLPPSSCNCDYAE